MKICKNCGEINSNDNEFCCHCGRQSFVYQEETRCPICGAVNDKSFVYCLNCGNVLRTAKADVSKVAPNVKSPQQPRQDDGYTPVPLDLREQMSDVYGSKSTATPAETAQCPSCGSIVPIHSIYCQKCGEPVDKLHLHRVVKRKICPHCGRPNSLESHFCSYCFCSLSRSDTVEMQLVHDTQTIGDEVVKQAYLEDERGKKKICTNCGSLNNLDELFCVNCGLKLDVEEQKKYCPNCGAENAVLNTFCTKCQWSFEGAIPGNVDKWVCARCQNTNDARSNFCTHCGASKVITGRE